MKKLLILASALLVAALSCKSPGGFVLTAEDEALLDSIERRTIRYFTDFPGEYSGMARERNNDQNGNIVCLFFQDSGDPVKCFQRCQQMMQDYLNANDT